MAIVPAKRFGIKFLDGSVRNAIPNTRGFSKFRLLSRLSFVFADVIAANSLTGLHNQEYTRPKGVCIYNGFDFSRLSDLEAPENVREKFGITTGKVVGMVGSFLDAKDYKTFIAAAGRIAAKRDDVTFVAVGDGPDLAGYKENLDPALNGRFKFLGKQTDVESIVNIFDIGVLACNTKGHAEGLSNSIMEYMALGKPVVATDSGGNSELVLDNRTGFVVRAFDEDELAARLEFLLENEDKAAEMGRAGRKRIEEFFSLDRMVREYIKLYNDMVKVKG
jgi:glycosyltransferase involved in cell wall biosynthesis